MAITLLRCSLRFEGNIHARTLEWHVLNFHILAVEDHCRFAFSREFQSLCLFSSVLKRCWSQRLVLVKNISCVQIWLSKTFFLRRKTLGKLRLWVCFISWSPYDMDARWFCISVGLRPGGTILSYRYILFRFVFNSFWYSSALDLTQNIFSRPDQIDFVLLLVISRCFTRLSWRWLCTQWLDLDPNLDKSWSSTWCCSRPWRCRSLSVRFKGHA